MEINRWKGLEDQYDKMLKDGYAYKKEVEHLDHSEMDEIKKENLWDMYLEKWREEGWSIGKEIRCENITLVKGDSSKRFAMNVWCGCVNENE